MPSLHRLFVFRSRVLLAAALASCQLALPGRAEDAAMPTNGVAPLARTLQNVLMPVEHVQLSSRAAGVIERFGAEEGQHVERGALLVQLNSDVERADVERAKAAVAGAEAQLRHADYELKRITELRNDELRIGAEKDLKEAQFNHQIAMARKKQAEADLQMAEARLHERSIFAPISGTVLRRTRTIGEAVERLETVIRLVDASMLELTIFAGAELLGKFKDGQPVRLKIDTGPARGELIESKVFHVDPTMDPETSTFRVRIRLEPNDKIQPGIFVSVQPPSEVN